MRQNLGELKEVSFNTFEDSHGRTIIADRKNRVAYIVEKQDMRMFGIMQNRFLLPGIVFILVGNYWSWIWGLILGVVTYLAMEIYFRTSFLIKLPQVGNVDFPARSSVYKKSFAVSMGQLYGRFGVMLLMAIALIWNINNEIKDWKAVFSFQDNNALMLVIMTFAFAGICLYVAGATLFAIIKRLGEKK